MIAVGDLAPTVFGPCGEGIYSVFALYADESGHKRWLVAGSFFGLASDFPEIEKKWLSRLKQDGVSYFHAFDCEALKNDFNFVARGLDQDDAAARKRADALRNDLATIVGESEALGGIAIGLNLRDFREVIRTIPAAQKIDKVTLAYRLLIRDCIQKIDKDWPDSRGLQIAFTFDERSQWKAAEKAYRQLKESNPDIAGRMGAVIHADDKSHPALQMADLMASETRYAFEEGGVDKSVRPAFKILKDCHSVYFINVVEKKQFHDWFQKASITPRQ